MSSFSQTEDCPRCGSKESLEASYDNKEPDNNSGICLECGYFYLSTYRVMSLQEANYMRKEYDLPLLTELKKPLPEWVDAPDTSLDKVCTVLNILFYKIVLPPGCSIDGFALIWVYELEDKSINIKWDSKHGVFMPLSATDVKPMLHDRDGDALRAIQKQFIGITSSEVPDTILSRLEINIRDIMERWEDK